MAWGGEYVSEQLGFKFEENPQILKLQSLTGLALRENTKRAHLLVSKVLGKHIPVDPRLILGATEILAVLVDEKLNKKPPVVSTLLLTELSEILEKNSRFSRLQKLLDDYKCTSESVVLGYAETATALGAIVAQKLGSYYIHSTRYPDLGAAEYGSFEEEHSHASSHKVTPADPNFLNSSLPLILVDDELTTGTTVMNTIKALQMYSERAQYVVVSLVDLRSQESRDTMNKFAKENKIVIDVVALSSGVVSIPENNIEVAQKLLHEPAEPTEYNSSRGQEIIVNTKDALLVGLQTKNGATDLTHYVSTSKQIAEMLTPILDGENVLILGVEEEMFLPILVAKELTSLMKVSFSSTTRSPVFSRPGEEYAIQDKICYSLPFNSSDTSDRFAYNVGNNFDNIVILVNEAERFNQLDNLIAQLKERTDKIIIMNYSNLSAPLTGPAFGSYSAEDVQWLLKDLSDVKLEVVTEEREEAIQSGGAHYAESLPIEYQPTLEYQDLFKVSLEESAEKIAIAVGVVAERILEQRNSPVLVSLARAGTPVGILIKRYLKGLHGLTVPHYAVSIVRGKGIDYNALAYLAAHHKPEDIIFVDGWTGKGAIAKELEAAIQKYGEETGTWFKPDLAVLADPGSCVRIFGTRDDYLIPSACLNSTVSGLISRTVLNSTLIGENDYHGAKFYKEFEANDYSNYFIEEVVKYFPNITASVTKVLDQQAAEDIEPTWAGWASIEKVNKDYGVNNINLVKPGVGETTRVLLRRVPWKILIRKDQWDALLHIRMLAEEKGTELEIVTELPYSCIGLIHPKYTKGATGFGGTAANDG